MRNRALSLGVKRTTHLHLVPKSRMCGALLPLSQYAFMAWCSVKAQDNFNFQPLRSVTCGTRDCMRPATGPTTWKAVLLLLAPSSGCYVIVFLCYNFRLLCCSPKHTHEFSRTITTLNLAFLALYNRSIMSVSLSPLMIFEPVHGLL
jgi:hypothetical protein